MKEPDGITSLPEGFIHHLQLDKCILSENLHPKLKLEVVGPPCGEAGPPHCRGARWHYGPLWFEQFTGDTEPPLLEGPARFLIWQRIVRQDVPPNWHRGWEQVDLRKTGFAEITKPARYFEQWTPHARYYRARFLKDTRYRLTETDISTFMANYEKTSRPSWLTRLVTKRVRRRKEIFGENVHFFIAQRNDVEEPASQQGGPAAGLAVLDLPEISQSIHLTSFIKPFAREDAVGIGLIDHWFSQCAAKGIRFLNFGIFYTAGDPKSWQGFSRFKNQFGIRYIRYPKLLWRIVGKR